MVRTFIKGETEEDGLTISWQDSETGERSLEHIEFNDYLYIRENDYHMVKEELASRWKKSIKKILRVNANNPDDMPDTFAKIVLTNNKHKTYINQWLMDEKEIQTYEGDLNTTKRFTIDNYKNLELNILKSRYIFYDIETDDRKNFVYDEYNRVVPENTILSFAATDFKGEKFFFINEDSENPECEKQLLLKIKDLFSNYAVTAGYNSAGFDDVYLSGRCGVHQLEDFTKDINKLDFMFSYKKYRVEVSLDSYSLDNVAEVELDTKKIDIRKGGGRLYQLYLEDKQKLEEYNIVDTEILYKLNKKLKFIELHLMTAHKGCCRVELTNYNIGSNDYFILMKCKDRDIIAYSNPNEAEKVRRRSIGGIGGGYTRGNPGFYNNVATYDFSSLYPSLEITYNISPETFVGNATIESEKEHLENKDKDIKVFSNYDELKQHCLDNGYIHTPSDLTYVAKQGREIYHPYRFFKNHKIGLLPSIMIELLEDRMAVKKSMKSMDIDSVEYDTAYNEQLALKYMLNSSYGLNALPSYRFFKFDVADAITTSGRVNTKRIRKYAEENGFKVVYSDTDSVGITVAHEISFEEACVLFGEFDKALVSFVDDLFKDSNNNVYKREDRYGTHNHRLILEWEKTFKTLLYKKKKRYAGLIRYPDGKEKVDITGLESTTMNVLAAKLQKDLITDVLNGNFKGEEWSKKMYDLYEKCFNGAIEEENLYINMKFTERAANQKRPRAHTLLAERMIEQGLDVAVGDKIKYIVEVAKPKQYAVTPEEFRERKTYPAEYYWDIFTKPTISLMGIIKGEETFNIIPVPDIIKIQDKLAKETDDEKIMKLRNRLDKKIENFIDLSVDEQEESDTLLDE